MIPDIGFKKDFDRRLYRLYLSLCSYFGIGHTPYYMFVDKRYYSGNLFPNLFSVFSAVWSSNIYLKSVCKSRKDKKS